MTPPAPVPGDDREDRDRGGPPSRLILFAHGSRDPEWREPFERLADALAADLGPGRVALAYLEFVGPTLEEALAAAAEDGVGTARVLPLFLAAGKHVKEDLPALATAAGRARGIRVQVLPPVGEDPRLLELMERIARESAGPPGGAG